MAKVRTVDFLPEIFQTSTNKQFLAATLDQLVQEPKFKKTQGYVGRRVGPGVDASDRYVVESTESRTDYQLEPGVIFKKLDSDTVEDAITYPGIGDALATQGAFTDNSDRLYTSEYYTWDPQVNFDKFVNFNQYYWLPGGPASVLVGATKVPLVEDFTVTRQNGVYTVSGYTGNNPAITLLRGGNYTFNVAQNEKETATFRVTSTGVSAFVINFAPNPVLTLVRGNTYVFNLNLSVDSPFWIKTAPTQGVGDSYNSGVLRNGSQIGNITFTVPQDAPDALYYASETQFNMQGQFAIVDGTPGTGPGFWIQSEPGVNGVLPWASNISSRGVLGVSNNGEDLGTVGFAVPQSTAQDFYYTLPTIGSVDLITNLKFEQLNNIFVSEFLIQNPTGIDNITNLNGRTVVFINNADADQGGWDIATQFDPLLNIGNAIGGTGSFDSVTFAQATPLLQALRYSVWQIEYATTTDGQQYIRLNSVLSVANLEKFNILFGTEYSSTDWYKNASGIFEQIPLLTAVNDTLYYQDGEDANIFGQFRIIDQSQTSTILINDIIGQANYTSPTGIVFSNGLKVQFGGTTIPAEYENQEYYVEGVGTAINLLPVTNFVTPETYTQSATVPYDSMGYDIGNYDASLNEPLVPDYFTINRASPDQNAWSRSNRWFHIDVINASNIYNNVTPVLDNNLRAKRPILEFHAGTKLFDYGTQGVSPVDVIDFTNTDALSNINGSTGYGVDGYTLINGSRIIFAADTDPQVRNKIYEVEFIVPDTVAPLITQPIINLIPAADVTVLVNQSVVCMTGVTLQGLSFYFDGVEWTPSQAKTKTNQAPLFDVFDSAGISFGDTALYPSTTFGGSKLFSYAIGTGAADAVLGLPLRYLSLANIGDIVFDNNLYTDTFVYVVDRTGITANVSNGFVHRFADRVEFARKIGWQTAATPSHIRQQFQFIYDGAPLILDVNVPNNSTVPAVQIYIGNKFVLPADFAVTTTEFTTTIVLSKIYTPGSTVEIQVLSDQVSASGFYQVPINLENNPFNINSPNFTLGTVRTHYESIAENLVGFSGTINGANNTRDLGNIGRYGTTILQQSSPLTLAGFFMRSREYNIFQSLEFNDREYNKFKNRMLENIIRNEWDNFTTAQILDSVMTDMSLEKSEINSFFWSDMLPTGNVYTEVIHTVTPITTGTFDTVQTYTFTSSNYLGLLVYLNNNLLMLNYDYTVAADGPRVTVTADLAAGDKVTIREYTTTTGNFVPNTPTKLGLYTAYAPEMFLDTNYVQPTMVIRGHDGSITAAFNDMRDDVLLEFERRIFNNLKTENNPIPLSAGDVIPGYFRTTDYTANEITTILGESFLMWVGQNKLDYKTQQYISSNAFTYNYSQAGDKEKNQPLLGAWRGISRNFYDTLSPNTTPWEMLGFGQKPTWWETRYGPAPYTQDNLVLWDDIQAGLVADPVEPYIIPKFVRPNLSTYFIPTGPEGALLSPLDSVVGQYDPTAFRKSWLVGDGGPAESAWWSSSSYPFAVMRLLALTRPAEFFSLFADRDLYKYDTDLEQYLYNGRYRLDATGVQIYGNGTSKASFINWIVDYNQQLGVNSTTALENSLSSLDVRLCWRTASFTDKEYLKVYTERSSPNSLNASLLLPPESYNLLLYKNSPFSSVVYSAVIMQQTDNGYAVLGYSSTDPYFNIVASRANGVLQTVDAGGSVVRVPKQYTNNVVQVPYGFVFTNKSAAVDFLLSYGQYLASRGLLFENRENGYTLDWQQMAREFLYWANQGWATGSLINLNPAADRLVAEQPGSVIDNVLIQDPENIMLDQNRQPFNARNLIVERIGNKFSVTSGTGQAIAYANLKYVSYETLVILDNVSIFADLIYNPATAARQNRVNVSAMTTTEWDGTLNAQGFILNQDNVQAWASNRKYAKGEIVNYKNNYWSAQTIVQPKLEFVYSDWIKSDYTKIQKGLLPNIANKADQLASSYDTQTANLARDSDLVSYGLIGFQPREYMAALNLDDTSQVNLYKQFIKSKGTVTSAELFTGANLGKEIADYQIYENWAVLRGTYGANANRSYFEVRLDEALLQSDPATVQIIQPGDSSVANQTVLLNDLWRESYKITSTNILPTTTTVITDTALPNAGYVNINDVDITVFSLDDPSAISADLDNVGQGTRIWVAKSNSYEWNVYRATQTPGKITRVSDNLDGTSLVTFSNIHNLSRGDLVIVRFFNDSFNGVYRVLTTPKPSTITVAYVFPATNQTTATGSGLAFYLDTMRVSQASDIANLSYANDLIPGMLAWVDNNGLGLWEVLEKQEVFAENYSLTPTTLIENTGYGSSIAQAQNNISALVGAPSYFNNSTGTKTGLLYPYLRGPDLTYIEDQPLLLTAAGTLGFGNAVDIGDQTWAVAGASLSLGSTGYASIIYRDPGSNQLTNTQLLVAPDNATGSGFGTDVAISRDERWVYISAPGADSVYAYGRVDIDEQEISYLTTGLTNSFLYSAVIVIDYTLPDQLLVVLNNTTQVNGVDYTVTDTSIVFVTTPPSGLNLRIVRRQASQLDNQTYYQVTQDSVGIGSGATFTVERTRGTYSVSLTSIGLDYVDGEVLTINAVTIGGGTNGVNDLIITVDTTTVGAILTFTPTGSGVNNTPSFDLSEYLYTVAADVIDSFTLNVNGEIQRPYIDYTFVGSTVVFDAGSLPAPGAIIVAASATYFRYTNPSIVPTIKGTVGSNFGTSIASATDGRQVVVGAPSAVVSSLVSGSTRVYDRSVLRYQVAVGQASTTSFALPAGHGEPIAVLINNEFLTDATQFINGGYTVVGNDVVLTSAVVLAVGDIIEIESNIFNQVQQITVTTEWDLLNQSNNNTAISDAQFGFAVDLCSNNCSIYIGAPQNTNNESGIVQRNVNQSRVYGLISSPVANPVLTAGQTIRVNNYEVAVPATYVKDGVIVPGNNVAGLAFAINSSNNGIGVPNVLASVSDDLVFTATGIVTEFDIGVTYSQYTSYTTVVYVDDILQTSPAEYSYNTITDIIKFVAAPASGSVVRVVTGIMTIGVVNAAAAQATTKLNVLPGITGTAFNSIGFVNYSYTQTITSPNPTQFARFGSTVFIDTTALTLVVGAPRGNMYEPVTFDNSTTYFDDRSTLFSTTIVQSGVAYTFDYLPSASDSVVDPGKFVLGQQLYNNNTESLDQYGTAISYVTGRLLIGSPGSDSGDSDSTNYGRVTIFENPTRIPAWTVKHTQQPVVDVGLLNSVYMYDKLATEVTSYLDFFDPLQGKILGVARENIDYIGAVDPANYNNGPVHNVGNPWTATRIGEIWWDTNLVRFIDPNQDDIVYASRRWGQTFPGSSIDIYQWIESDVTPANYIGAGTPLSVVSYSTRAALNSENIFATRYYFWVRNISTVNTAAGKKLSTTAIANYIEFPRASGIAYLAPLSASTVAIYNVLDLVSARDTILHIEYDQLLNDDNIHQEYELVANGRADSFLSDTLYLKLQDSFSGINAIGASVPDAGLSPAMRYGVQFRPRQSMFIDRFAALQNYLGRANTVLAQYPISETKNFSLLNSSEPTPAAGTGAWDKRVVNLEELGYQNLVQVPYGYKYLVASDSNNAGFWTIYEVVAGATVGSRELGLIRVQNYDTRRYWYYIDWYQPGYNRTINPVATVENYAGLSAISLTTAPVGASVKILDSVGGKFEIYQRTDIGWARVGLEDGTIEFSNTLWDYTAGNFGFDVEVFDAQYFDQVPSFETRKIIQAINEQLFIDELAIERNRALMLVFEFVMSETAAPDWLMKTSLIDVDHKIRELLPYEFYNQDNQDFVLNYIQEVKPYHTQIREFNLSYSGIDTYAGAMTDFDVPAYWNAELVIPQFISPVLLPYTQSTASSPSNPNAEFESNAVLWTNTPWNEWYNNHTLTIQAIVITNSGSNYTVAPLIVVSGNCTVQAEMTAIINGAGQVVGITIDNYGSGYTTTAIITFVGSGAGATAAATMGNALVRQIKTTMKYDRYEYSSDIAEWVAGDNYDNGTLVRYLNRVWEADASDSAGILSNTFDPGQWTIVNPALLSGVDRTMGFYTPTANEPGLSLPLIIDGVEYPGVQVSGVGYDQYPGFDIAPFDTAPFDNIVYGPEGAPTYDQSILDAIYQSEYTDPYLGILPASINADGGAYIDTYSSYAPEELVPGSEFDTLDMRVYTTPGADWARDGHGFRIELAKFAMATVTDTFSFEGVLPTPATLMVTNQTNGLDLAVDIDYTADWANSTITLVDHVSSVGDIIVIQTFSIGGGNQLLKRAYNGSEVGDSIVVPVQASLVQEFIIFVNGTQLPQSAYAYQADSATSTQLTFDQTYATADYLMIAAIGPTTVDNTVVDYSWSVPVTQNIAGVNGQYIYDLSNSMEYTNPDNVHVTVDGVRVRTSAGIAYYADGTSDYLLPDRLGVSQALIADNEVRVYINNVPQILGVDFTVEPYDVYTPRAVMLTSTPSTGERILICVTTNAQATVIGTQLLFNQYGGLVPLDGEIISVTSWNDTRQQDVLTQVYVGPVFGSATLTQAYDSTTFDVGTVIGAAGSFDYALDQTVTLNNLFIDHVDVDADRLIVTLNGLRLYVNVDFVIVDNEIILPSGYIMSSTDVVMITQFTSSVAPDAMAFRIFQDMRGVQATYRITADTTTYLVQELGATDDTIYVYNASGLNQPNLAQNIWGLLTIGGERIMYRNRDTVANTISGLRRGTAGTGAADHAIDTDVYNISRGNLLQQQYQNYILKTSELANGVQTQFTADIIDLNNEDSTTIEEAVEVYIGGTRQFGGYSIVLDSPVVVVFAVAPAAGSEVTILVRQGATWYAPGVGTASNGVALQDTDTDAARFLRGE